MCQPPTRQLMSATHKTEARLCLYIQGPARQGSHTPPRPPNKKRPSSSNFGKDEERSICSRGTTFIRCSLTASASLYGVTVGVTCTSPANGGHPVEFYFRVGDFFSQLQGLLHGIGIRAFQQPPALWMRQVTVTRPCKAFILCDCS